MRVQWTRLLGALPTTQFVEQIKRILAAPDEVVVIRPPARADNVARSSRNGPWAVVSLLAVVIIALTAVLLVLRHSQAKKIAAQVEAQAQVADSKSIAVLPF